MSRSRLSHGPPGKQHVHPPRAAHEPGDARLRSAEDHVHPRPGGVDGEPCADLAGLVGVGIVDRRADDAGAFLQEAGHLVPGQDLRPVLFRVQGVLQAEPLRERDLRVGIDEASLEPVACQ